MLSESVNGSSVTSRLSDFELLKRIMKSHRCRSRQFLEVQSRPTFCPNFPKFARKTPMRQTLPLFSIHIFVLVGTLYFPLPYWHRLENRKCCVWNLVLYNPTEKCARLCKNIIRSQLAQLDTLSICLTVLRFGGPFTFQLLLSTRNLTPSWGSYFLLWRHICDIYGMFHIILIMSVPRVS